MNKMKKIADVITSMKFRVYMIVFVAILIPVIGSNIFVMKLASKNYISQKFEKFQNQNNVLKNCIISENYLDTKDSEIVDAELSQMTSGYDGRVEIINSDYVIIKDTYNSDEGKTNISESVVKSLSGNSIYNYNENEHYVEYAIPIVSTMTNVEGITETIVNGALYIKYSTADTQMFEVQLGKYVLVIDLILVLFALVVALFCSRTLSKPIKEIEKSIEHISYGDMDAKIEVKGYAEIRRIIEEFNQMVEKLASQDESRQQFVSNVSHELKTPITSMKVLADSLIGQEGIPEELYQEFLTDITKEIDRENAIITDLLTLVKMDKNQADINVATVNINELVEAALKRLRPIAAMKNIEVVLESFRPVVADIDEVKFSMVVSNLVENAIKYNITDGWIRVSINADHQYFYLKVADSGIGIQEEEQGQIFERFFRVDKARARETGGTGLGLSITKSIILMHKGTIKIHSKEGEGTTFTVRIPLKYIKE